MTPPSTATEKHETGDGHARQMDGVYAMQRHIYDATRKYYLLGRDQLIRQMNVPHGGHVLELGCGTARNMALAAKAYPSAQFYGLDISSEMLKSAERNLTKATVRERCHLAQGDASDFDAPALFGRARFDRIFCSYTLSMIPDWRMTLDIGCSLLNGGGEFHIVDFGQQNNLPPLFSTALRAWLGHFHVNIRDDLWMAANDLALRHRLTIERKSLYRDYARSVALRRNN